MKPLDQAGSEREQLRRYLEILKLPVMRASMDEELDEALRENQSAEALLLRLFGREADGLVERRVERRIRESRLPERKTLADFDFAFQTGLDKRRVLSLTNLEFVGRGLSLVFAGHSGTGKSHIAKALVLLACGRDIRCRYVTAADMLSDLKSGLVDDSLETKLKTYLAPELLCIDEVGFDRLEQEESRQAALFFKVIDGRYGKRSTILTTNMDFKALGAHLGDPVMMTALLDRLVHHALIFKVEGPSWRMHQSKLLNND